MRAVSVASADVSICLCCSMVGCVVDFLCHCAVYVGGGLLCRCVMPLRVEVNHCLSSVCVYVSREDRLKVMGA